LVAAPADYQQGDGYRIIFVHVPAAWMSLFVYVSMAVMAAVTLIWRGKMAAICARAAAPVGAAFTFLALVTGSIWGKPMWGTWWVWDARLTSELILLFLYLGYMALSTAFSDRRAAAQAGAVLLLVGVVNVPIIHFSVDWWNTLHQPATITKLGAPAMHPDMLFPLLFMVGAFMVFYCLVLSTQAQALLLEEEGSTRWAQQIVRSERGLG
jgi:heme exporter protein C